MLQFCTAFQTSLSKLIQKCLIKPCSAQMKQIGIIKPMRSSLLNSDAKGTAKYFLLKIERDSLKILPLLHWWASQPKHQLITGIVSVRSETSHHSCCPKTVSRHILAQHTTATTWSVASRRASNFIPASKVPSAASLGSQVKHLWPA